VYVYTNKKFRDILVGNLWFYGKDILDKRLTDFYPVVLGSGVFNLD